MATSFLVMGYRRGHLWGAVGQVRKRGLAPQAPRRCLYPFSSGLPPSGGQRSQDADLQLLKASDSNAWQLHREAWP